MSLSLSLGVNEWINKAVNHSGYVKVVRLSEQMTDYQMKIESEKKIIIDDNDRRKPHHSAHLSFLPTRSEQMEMHANKVIRCIYNDKLISLFN